MIFLKTNWKIISIALGIAFVFYLGWHSRSILEDSRRADILKKQIEQYNDQAKQDFATQLESERKKIEFIYKSNQLTGDVSRETIKPEYRCPVNPISVQYINSAFK